MVFDELKYRALVGLFDIAGQVVSNQLTKPSYDKHEKLSNDYFNQLRGVAKKEGEKRAREQKRREYKPPEPETEPTKDTVEEVEGGTACVPCSRDHFSTVSGALNEALRFARKEGVGHAEVMRRIGDSLDELNMLERIDLSASNLVQLKGKEKQLAEWGLNASRNLRHNITAIKTPQDLERVAAEAANIRTKFMRNMWEVATTDGSVEKLCKGLKDEERERCISVINNVLEKK